MLAYNIAIVSLAIGAISFIYYITNSYMGLKYKHKAKPNKTDTEKDVTIIVPVYKEDPKLFAKCIESIKRQNTAFIVAGDSSDEPYRTITERNGGQFILLKERGGKRRAQSTAIKHIKTNYVLFVDSDTLIPDHAVRSMLSKFSGNIGGVGTKISIRLENNWVSYCSEFFQKTKELVFRAMASKGPILVISGRCAMFKTEAIKPFLLSDEFIENRILGKRCMIADDMHLTNHILNAGYGAVIDYDVNVVTDAQQSMKQMFNQMVRWARGGYLYFLKDIYEGTFIDKGAMYSFELFYIYLLPIVLVITGISRFRLMLSYGLAGSLSGGISGLTHLFLLNSNLGGASVIPVVTATLGLAGLVVFVYALLKTIPKNRLKTLAAGGIASIIMFCASVYALFTMWEQEGWLTR